MTTTLRFLGSACVIGLALSAVILTAAGTRTGQTTQAAAKASAAVRVFLTARDTTDRLTEKPEIAFAPLTQPGESSPVIMVDLAKTFQTIEGFGGALTDAAAETYFKLPEASRRELIRAYFDVAAGIGYRLCRTHINSCDFSSASYAYDEVPGDMELEHFSIGRDLKFRVPLIREAQGAAGGDLKIFASPWSPPAWMKTNNDMLHGGRVKPEYREAWAEYFVKFIRAYGEAGVPIWGVTVQNEPMATQTWESCLYTGEEERDFVRDHLGPALERAGLSQMKIIVWDHNRGLMFQRAQAVYDDPRAARYVWGLGFHWYVGDHFDNVRIVHEAFPQKKLLFTEGCQEAFDPARLGDWAIGERYGRSLLQDLGNWADGWVDWNILLDERGGPNHVGNYCFAPVIADTRTGKLTYVNSYYYLGQVSKFVRPGARRVACSSNDDGLLAAAFINPDGTAAVVLMNEGDQAREFSLWTAGQAASTVSPAHSMMTLVFTP